MKAFEIENKLRFDKAENKKTGKVYEHYPYIGNKMLTNKYIDKFEAKKGFLCLNGEIFHDMSQFGSLNYEKEIDEHIDQMANELPQVDAVDRFSKE